MKILMCHLSATLTPREEQILRMRFGIAGGLTAPSRGGQSVRPHTQRIRQIEAKALRKLRQTGCSRKLEGFMERE
jgi:RNA polymerase primary sigma factor